MGVFARMVSTAVKQLGGLFIDVIINHQTIGDVEEVMSGDIKIKYPTFLVRNQMEKGRSVNKKIRFKDKYTGRHLTDKEIREEEKRILKEEGGFNSDLKIIEANPVAFSKLKYLCYIEPDEWLPESKRFKEFLQLEAFDKFVNNPFVDQEELTRKAIGYYYKDEAEELMTKPPVSPVGLPERTGAMQQVLGKSTANAVAQEAMIAP